MQAGRDKETAISIRCSKKVDKSSHMTSRALIGIDSSRQGQKGCNLCII
uniref:Uncharacterized protein n=1 Tax=Rhizophora mucronata TaxID=61149 RepID=A0A2P2J4S5_RHIMU